MNTTSLVSPPVRFWLSAALLMVWNLFGLWMCWSQYHMPPEQMAALPEAQRNLFANTPGWVWLAYAVAVTAGWLGALLLLLRKRLALPLFWVSLVAVLLQFGYSLGPGGAVAALGAAAALPLPLTIIAVCLYQVWLSRTAIRRRWIG